MVTAAIIVAAGRGTRARGDVPKQYTNLAGKPVLSHTLCAFEDHGLVDHVQVVIHDDDRSAYTEACSRTSALPPVQGGETRQQSVMAGLSALVDIAPDHVLIHDAARPFVDAAVIDRVIAALEKHDGAIPALPVSDTIKRVDGDVVAQTIERTGLWTAQTPQGFRFAAILQAHRDACKQGRSDLTDDAAVAEWHGLQVAIVEGSADNVKLTTTADIEQAQRRMSADLALSQFDIRVGYGYDVHGFEPGDHVMLCGVKITHDAKLKGHSDADVGLHALTDAIFGALGDGDIGQHFPPCDPKWKGADSEVFLDAAGKQVSGRAGTIANVDVTLVCEAPRIGPHAPAMRARIAQILGIATDRVSIKATTSEGLGFTGRREGIAAHAMATIRLPG